MKGLKKWYSHQLFFPGVFSLFFHPFWLIRRNLLMHIRNLAPQLSGQLMDYGCGAKPYQSLFKVERYVGVDMENPGHSHEQEEVDVFYDGKTLPFDSSTFDSVFASEVLEHVFEPDNALREIHRVMKPGGKILLTVPFVWNEHEIPNDYGRYTSFGLNYLLEKNGFTILEMRKSGSFISVLHQLQALYFFRRIERLPPYFRIALMPFLTAPFQFTGWWVSAVLPKDESLYFNLIVLAEKSK
jgi:SAM-dependent methyltransferase